MCQICVKEAFSKHWTPFFSDFLASLMEDPAWDLKKKKKNWWPVIWSTKSASGLQCHYRCLWYIYHAFKLPSALLYGWFKSSHASHACVPVKWLLMKWPFPPRSYGYMQCMLITGLDGCIGSTTCCKTACQSQRKRRVFSWMCVKMLKPARMC